MYEENLKRIARGNWRNVGVIGYQIGIKREKIKNDRPKIKRLQFLNTFDFEHNPGFFSKVTFWDLLPSFLPGITPNITETKVTEAEAQ